MNRILLFLVLASLVVSCVAAYTEHSHEAAVYLVSAGLFGVLWLGFLPTCIAIDRGHPNRVPILLVNLFVGWSGIGWVVALVWACTAIPEPTQTRGFADG